jgi:hypothetical protein
LFGVFLQDIYTIHKNCAKLSFFEKKSTKILKKVLDYDNFTFLEYLNIIIYNLFSLYKGIEDY